MEGSDPLLLFENRKYRFEMGYSIRGYSLLLYGLKP